MIRFGQLPQITKGTIVTAPQDAVISGWLTDSRKINSGLGMVFLAIRGPRNDGHDFINDVYRKGFRNFIIERDIEVSNFPEANILKVNSTVDALQKIVAFKRSRLNIPVIGITGSNGKTIVKEWLSILLSPENSIAKSPGSYNSQLGVPLSVWQLNERHTLGIFEAGISKLGEMAALESVIQPTFGIFTNLLRAHDEGFESANQKAQEKSLLFKNCTAVIYCSDHKLIHDVLLKTNPVNRRLFSWGYNSDADVKVEVLRKGEYQITYSADSFILKKDFTDSASIENLFHCIAALLYLGYKPDEISKRVDQLRTLPMRLELKEGINGSSIIDDSYSNDLAGLKIALDFMQGQGKTKNMVILTDMLESGMPEGEWIDQINEMLLGYSVEKTIGIGNEFVSHAIKLNVPSVVFSSTEDALNALSSIDFSNRCILIKGARSFHLERIVNKLQKKIHGTVMEINLASLVHNLNVFRSRLNPVTKVMAMVKAFAYGSGSHEVASILQFHKVNYLGVAYTDEGIVLRSHGIILPIMVMNSTTENFQAMKEYNLEPSVYSVRMLKVLIQSGLQLNVHLKVDTGMHRLGFDEGDQEELGILLKSQSNLTVSTVYSHLAGGDEAIHDDFSLEQVQRFNKFYDFVSDTLGYRPIRHILNSAGTVRLNQFQFDMVRLGIGLYGFDPSGEINNGLKSAVTLKATISQIKNVPAGETIGYGRHGVSKTDLRVATISIGYAAGYFRAFSKGTGKVMVNGRLAPVIGNVCMDMTMIDVTGIDVNEGDEVEIFGNQLPIEDVASWINTIPYEILTNTSERVKRVFYTESI